MATRFPRFHAFAFALALFVAAAATAQNAPPPAMSYPQDQLDGLLAPIALYPDQLLTQVLIASTYPLEVVEAARFVQQNPGLQGADLDSALAARPWDPSVLSLAAFPQVLAMMYDKLEWTQQLGDAFLANEGQVMETVQSLRARARAAGNLQDTPQQSVVVQERTIVIQPAQPQVVYVPVYNPTVIYGPWWAPAYRPWYWYPPPIYGYPAGAAFVGAGFAFGIGYAIGRNNWGWATPNWSSRNVNINVTNNYYFNRPNYSNRYQNGNWQHAPEHRRGIAYRDPATRDRYVPTNNAAVQSREAYRGYGQNQGGTRDAQRPGQPPSGQPGTRPPGSGTGNNLAQPGTRPTPAGVGTPTTRPPPRAETPSARPPERPAASPVYNTRESRPQVQQDAQRGQQSRQSMQRSAPPQSQSQSQPQPQARPAAAESRPSAPAGRSPAPGGQQNNQQRRSRE